MTITGCLWADDAVLAGLCADHGVNLRKRPRSKSPAAVFCARRCGAIFLPADPARLTDFTRIGGPGGRWRSAILPPCIGIQRDWLDCAAGGLRGRATVVTHHVPHPALLAKATTQSRGICIRSWG